MPGRFARAPGSTPMHNRNQSTSRDTQTRHPGKARENGNDNKNEEDGVKDDVTSGTRLDISSKELPPKESLIEAFSRLKQLQRLDMSGMKPSEENDNPNGLDTLSWMGKAISKSRKGNKSDSSFFGKQLSWLKFSDNPSLGKYGGADSWDGLEQFVNLTVLNASSCELPVAPPSFTLMAWQSLGALVLGHNSIASLPHFPSMPQLNTIVLSHNQITSLPKDLPANLPALKKLSITHNQLQWTENQSPLPDFSICSHLREVRISGNSQLIRLPAHMSGWGKGVGRDSKGTGLETFEAGDCGLSDWESISPLLQSSDSTSTDRPEKEEKEDGIHPSRRRRVRGFLTLSLRGNEVTKLQDYRDKILEAHPSLRVLDSVKLKDESKMQEEFQATLAKLTAPPKPIEQEDNRVEKSERVFKSKYSDRGNPRGSQNKPTEAVPRDTLAQGRSSRTQKPRYDREGEQDDVRNKDSRVKQKFERKIGNVAPQEQNDIEPISSEEANRKKLHKRGGRGKAKGNKKKDSVDGEKMDGSSMKDPFLRSAQKPKETSKEDEDAHLARIRARAGPAVMERSKESKKKDSLAKKNTKDSKEMTMKDHAPKSKTTPAKASKSESTDTVKKRKVEVEDTVQTETSNKKSRMEKKEEKSEGESKEDVSSVARVVNVVPKKGKNAPKAKQSFEFKKKAQSSTGWGAAGKSNGLDLGSGGAWN